MLIRLVAVAFAALLVAVLAIAHGDEGRPYGGPLEDPAWREGSAIMTSVRPPRPGGTAASGMAVVANRGRDPAVIERIRPVKPSRNLRVAAIYTADHRRDAWGGDQNSWPPHPDEYQPGSIGRARGRAVPPAGQGLKSELGLQILILVDLPRAGRYTFRGVRVDYRVGGDRYWIVVPTATAFCTPRKVKCPTPEPYKGPYHGD